MQYCRLFIKSVVTQLLTAQKTGGVSPARVLAPFLSYSGLLFQEYKNSGGLRIPRFLIRRGFKSWPSYYLLVIGVGVRGRLSPVMGIDGFQGPAGDTHVFHLNSPPPPGMVSS
jgi:hypothetical protein